MPENTVYVGRPSDWGNPFKVQAFDKYGQSPFGFRVVGETSVARKGMHYRTEEEAMARAVELFREKCRWPAILGPRMKAELRGRNLACWCPLDQPCHADVLLEWANAD